MICPVPFLQFHINITKCPDFRTGRLIPTSGLLHMLFQLPGMLSGQISLPQKSLPWPSHSHWSPSLFYFCYCIVAIQNHCVYLSVSSLSLPLECSTIRAGVLSTHHCILRSLNDACCSYPPTQITPQQHRGEGPTATSPGCWTLQLAEESFLLLELLIAATAGNDSPWAGHVNLIG